MKKKVTKKCYPPNSIITGIAFLQYLIDYNNYELTIVKNKNIGTDTELYKLPINIKHLKQSIRHMIDVCYKDDDYKESIMTYVTQMKKN